MLTKEIILSKYPNYSSIKDIKKLDIWGEDIENISIISKMTNLEILSLSSNKISTLSPLSYCLNLREIYLRNNKISSFEELYNLKKLHKLKVLWLEGNPISKDNFYKEKVMNILPRLHNLDNKNIILNRFEKKRGLSEEQKQIKNEYDYNANFKNSNRKKILLRRVFSYFDPSNDGVGYIDTSNDVSLGQNNKKNNQIKKVDLSELKIKYGYIGKSAKKERKERKSFKKIKLKIKNDNKINYNLYNNYMLFNLCSGQRMPNRKLTVDTNNTKPIIRDNITVQNSIIQQNTSELKEQNELKIKKISFFGNKDLYKNMYKCKNDDKISININNYENNNCNNNLIKAVYLLIDKMNVQDLLYLKEVINKKITILTK